MAYSKPGPKKETPCERQLRLQTKADVLADRIDINGCITVLRSDPLAVQLFKKKAIEKGWWGKSCSTDGGTGTGVKVEDEVGAKTQPDESEPSTSASSRTSTLAELP